MIETDAIVKGCIFEFKKEKKLIQEEKDAPQCAFSVGDEVGDMEYASSSSTGTFTANFTPD